MVLLANILILNDIVLKCTHIRGNGILCDSHALFTICGLF